MTRPADGHPGSGGLDAGEFGEWLSSMERALGGQADSSVPCGGCTACCTSSQFVDISADETDTLAHIPRQLLFPAPRRPGHLVLVHDQSGRCPMLGENGCSIYAHRPRACRVYDCRVYAAAGVEVEDDKPAIAARVAQWRFRYAGGEDEVRQQAVQAAAEHLRVHAASLPDEVRPRSAAGLAAAAVAVADHFTRRRAGGQLDLAEPDAEEVAVQLTRRLRPAEAAGADAPKA